MKKSKCTHKKNSNVYPKLIHASLLIIVLGALVDAPICIGVLLTLEGSQQTIVRSTAEVSTPSAKIQKPVKAAVTVMPEVPVVPARREESRLVEVPAENVKPGLLTVTPVAATPVAAQEKEGSKTSPSATELLEQAVKALVAAKKAPTETAFFSGLKEAKRLALKINDLANEEKDAEANSVLEDAKYVFEKAKELKKEYKAKKAEFLKQQQEEQERQKQLLAKQQQQKQATQEQPTPVDYEKTYQEFRAMLLEMERKENEKVAQEEKERDERDARQEHLYDGVIAQFKEESHLVNNEEPQPVPKNKVVVKANAKKEEVTQQGAGGNDGEQQPEQKKTAVMTYSGNVKSGFCFGTGEQGGFHQLLEGSLKVQAHLTDYLTFDGEGTVGVSLLDLTGGGDHHNPFVEIRKFSLTYESPSIEGLWVKAGKFEAPLFKNPVGGNLLCLHPLGLFAGYSGAGTEGWLGPQFEQLNFVGGFSQDPRLGSVFVGEVSAHTRETEFMGRICTFDLAFTNICSLSHGSWILNPKAAMNFSLWKGAPAVFSAELLIVLGGNSDLHSALRTGFRVGDVDEFGQPKEVGGWMFEVVSTFGLPDGGSHNSLAFSYTATVGTRPLDWLTITTSVTIAQEDGGFRNSFTTTASAQITEKVAAALTTEVAQSNTTGGYRPGVKAEVQYDLTDQLSLKKDGFFKTATVGANAFLSPDSTGVGVAFELGF